MRRAALIVLLASIPLLAVWPELAGAAPTHPATVASAVSCHPHGKTHCKKPTPTKHRKSKHHKKKRKKATPAPTATATATPTMTPTPTDTATPEPAQAQIGVDAQTTGPSTVVFLVCGLPSGVTASFGPNPAQGARDPSVPFKYDARSTLTLQAGWQVPSRSYSLEVYALYYGQAQGGILSPQFLSLTVNGSTASVSAAPIAPDIGMQNCSAYPPGYAPIPTVTIPSSDIQVGEAIVPSRPAPGATVTITAWIKARGQPVYGVPVTFTFYGPRPMPNCTAVTDTTGQAVCRIANTNPLTGANVLVIATFQFNNTYYTASASYTM
ncbi:MAG TPA: hypothetical protein VFB58_14615 [Chloroflexota bacterium]|nr:hypothetical protein [Chloroflexota bacterium]